MKELQYVSDVIKEEYKYWAAGDVVLLTAPTGTGKSHFVLYDLLKWAIFNLNYSPLCGESG